MASNSNETSGHQMSIRLKTGEYANCCSDGNFACK